MNKFYFFSKLSILLKKHTTQCILLFIGFFFLGATFINLPILKIHQLMPQHLDAYLISWIWSWDIHALITNPLNLFQANIFAPFHNTLAFSETMLGTAFLAWPILLIFNNIILAFNTVSLLTFAISGLGMYLLVYYLTKNKLAALLSAIIYAFAPFKLIHNGHLHLTGMWLPYVFLYLHKFFQNQTWKNTFLLTLFVILVFLTGFHYFIFLPIVILIFFLAHHLSKIFKFNKDNIKKIILSGSILLLITIPLIFPYIQNKKDYVQQRSIKIIEAYSPDLIDYFISPFFYNYFYNNYNNIEKIVSPGMVILLLLILSFYIFKKNKYFLSNYEFRKNFLMYGIILIIAFFISLGYYIKFIHSNTTGIMGLYALFYYLVPGFNGIRAIGRYSIFVLLSISVFIGYGFFLWDKKIKNIFTKILMIFIIILLLFFEFSFVPVVYYKQIKITIGNKQLYDWMSNQLNDKIFLELPMRVNLKTQNNYDIIYVFQSRLHFKKIVNGYSGYYPPGYLQLAKKVKIFTPAQDLEIIKKFKINYLIFHFGRYKDTTKMILNISKKVAKNANIKYITNFGNNYVYEIIY